MTAPTASLRTRAAQYLQPGTSVRTGLSRAWQLLLDIVYPPRCGGCDRRGTLFCDDCLQQIVAPPEEYQVMPDLEGLVSAGVFEGPLREAIHKLKYEGDTPLAKPLARLLYEALRRNGLAGHAPAGPLLVVPVPLHPDRERMRGFNQSLLISKELSRLSGWPLAAGLARVRDTRSQVGLSAQARVDNLVGAFAWRGGAVPPVALLVDDVCTTGATLREASRVLREAGVEEVYAATVARAQHPT